MVWALFGLAGIPLLFWPLHNSIYPVPGFPGNVRRYVVIAWILAGVLLLTLLPTTSVPAAPLITGPLK